MSHLTVSNIGIAEFSTDPNNNDYYFNIIFRLGTNNENNIVLHYSKNTNIFQLDHTINGQWSILKQW